VPCQNNSLKTHCFNWQKNQFLKENNMTGGIEKTDILEVMQR